MTDKPVDVLVLGPVGLCRDGEFLSPPSAVSRAILAALALAGSDGLTSSALFQTVWASRSASAERSTVTVSVHRLRQWLTKTVGDAVRLERTGAVYVLHMTGDSDVARFRECVTEGRSAEALKLWRGNPLADVPPESQDPVAVSVLIHDRHTAAMECSRDRQR